MTYFSKIRRALAWAAAATVSGLALFTGPAQAATVTFGSCTSGGTYTNITTDANGNFTITCSGGASAPGTIGFSANSYSGNTNSQVTVSLTRTGGSAGAASSSVSITNGGCTVAPGSVQWTDGDSGTKAVTVTTTPGASTCTVSGNAVTTAGSTGISTTVNIVDPNLPGTFAFSVPQSGPTINQDWSFTIQRSGGSNGAYDIPYTATPTGLTGASVGPASPIRFASGETTKTLTLTTGSTVGQMVLTFGTPIPVSPNTTPATASGPITITVTAGGNNGCPTPGTNVVVLPDMSVGEGSHALINLSPGQIGTARLPNLPSGVVGATITQTSTQGTSDITRVEMGISPCPGDILYGAPSAVGGGNNQQRFGYSPCYTSSPFITNNSVAWHLTVAGHYAFCYSPVATGPWYINVRYEMPVCSYGQGNCGASFQWNRR